MQIRVAPNALGTAVRSKLPLVAGFKDSHPERRLTRGLLSTQGEPPAGPGAVPADPPQQQRQTGRRQTRPTIGLEPEGWQARRGGADGAPRGEGGDDNDRELLWDLPQGAAGGGRQLRRMGTQITETFEASKLWGRGFHGEKVRMAVFDTGVRADHPHFRHIVQRTNWTSEETLDDGLGHGTFVAGIVAGSDPQCLGFAPEAEITTFRVFTNAQVSYTSWFLDAFNYAIALKMHVLNLSIGGPDYLDAPFVEKVWEVTANRIIMVSAIGNDGPLYGTLNNPADQMDVIGVGGIDGGDDISSFSSRGMTTWELPAGMGRFKPDVVAYGRDVMGSRIQGGCRPLSGTSVASPVVAGAVVLLASTLPEPTRWAVLNPASMKQALVEGAARLPGVPAFEQGAGRLSLLGAYEVLKTYQPRASALPAALDLTDCPYMWPFCAQPLYAGAMPVIINVTLLNGLAVSGRVVQGPAFTPTPGGLGASLDVRFSHSAVLWPWSGFLALYLRVKPEAAASSGTAEGVVTLTIESPPGPGEAQPRRSTVSIPLKAAVVATPPRQKRVLWDNFHSVRYPPGYVPRDNLDMRQDILDWHGDHPATNYHAAWDALRGAGYYVESLGSPFDCFDAAQYGALLLVDSEEEYTPGEAAKLAADVAQRGLGLVVFAEWYHVTTMERMRFFDDNTHSYWTPVTGGANVPALNDLLAPLGVALQGAVLKGSLSLPGLGSTDFATGTALARFPAGGTVHSFPLMDLTAGAGWSGGRRGALQAVAEAPVLGLAQLNGSAAGRLVVYGDSNCLDSSHMSSDCFWLLKEVLAFAAGGRAEGALFPAAARLAAPLVAGGELPLRRSDVDFAPLSAVLGKDPQCGLDTPPAFHPRSLVEQEERRAHAAAQAAAQPAQAAAQPAQTAAQPAQTAAQPAQVVAHEDQTPAVQSPPPPVLRVPAGGQQPSGGLGHTMGNRIFPVLHHDLAVPVVDSHMALVLAATGLLVAAMLQVISRRRGRRGHLRGGVSNK